MTMTKITLATLNQKFDDYTAYSREKLESIEKQAKLTNGRVTKSELKLNELETIRCEADKNKNNNRDWVGILIAGCALIVSLLTILGRIQ